MKSNMNSYRLMTIIIIVTTAAELIGLVDCDDDFCQLFANKHYQLSYTFQRIRFTTNPFTDLKVFAIDDNIWTHSDSFHKSVIPEISGTKYRTGFTLRDQEDAAIHGFLRADKPLVDWIGFPGKDLNDLSNPSQVPGLPQSHIHTNYDQQFNPTLSLSLFDKNWMCFYTINPDGQDFIGKMTCIDFEDKKAPKNVTQKMIDEWKDMPYLPLFTGNRHVYEIVLIMGPYSNDKFMVYYKTNTSIEFCTTDVSGFSFECNQGTNTLIDCVKFTPPPPPTQPTTQMGEGAEGEGLGSSSNQTTSQPVGITADESGNTSSVGSTTANSDSGSSLLWIIIVVIIIIIIIVAIVICVVCFMMGSRKSEDKKDSDSSAAPVKSKSAKSSTGQSKTGSKTGTSSTGAVGKSKSSLPSNVGDTGNQMRSTM
ncbi:uncharacterized protein LOC128961098 [Oppia nitens]|uniref:uncharacterized protein LOC128961098 n=1 Tax=Oppia nitens TaxID=1686743 RepID=UPI0023DA6066|nr:uncharacterized protein LOC128961098 [Oppia nitens]